MSKVRHHATGQLLEIVNVVLTDNNGTRSEPEKGSQVPFESGDFMEPIGMKDM